MPSLGPANYLTSISSGATYFSCLSMLAPPTEINACGPKGNKRLKKRASLV